MQTQVDYKKQIDFIYSFKPQKIYTFPGELGLRRTRVLLKHLNNPQEKIKVIHIAGTSGKGSTCYILSSLLIGQGFKTGLSLSPHLFDIRERTQINNNLISMQLYSKYIEEIKPAIRLASKETGSDPTHFEILTALNFYIFYKENVDYAIMETGLGGTFDATNVVSNPNKLSIITRIGFDHTKILGNTLSKIALQKGGIVNENSTFITIKQSKKINEIFKKIGIEKNSNIIQVSKSNYKKIKENEFSFASRALQLPKVHIGLNGDYQFENATIALIAVEYLSIRDRFNINKAHVLENLCGLNFTGRFSEILVNKKTVVFDGAHNSQKMSYFIKALRQRYPKVEFDFLVAFKHKKDYRKMLNTIIPIANSIALTTFGEKSFDKALLAKTLQDSRFENFSLHDNPKDALDVLLKRPTKNPIIVTGSLYLLSEFSKYLKKYD